MLRRIAVYLMLGTTLLLLVLAVLSLVVGATMPAIIYSLMAVAATYAADAVEDKP